MRRSHASAPSRHGLAIATLGVLLICSYPGVGGSISWLCGWDGRTGRRTAQAVILIIGLVGLLVSSRMSGVRIKRSLSRPLLMTAALGTMLIPLWCLGGRALNDETCGQGLWSTAWLAWASLWGSAIVIWVAAAFTPTQAPESPLQEESPQRDSLQPAISSIGLLLAIFVWFRGPGHDDGSVHLAMAGNPSFLVAACLIFGGVVLWRRGIVGAMCAIPWIYLSIVTTSRLAILLIPVIACVVPTNPLRTRSGWGHFTSGRLATAPILVLVATTFLVAPVTGKLPLPYRNSMGEVSSAREWASRQGRALRPFTEFGLIDLTSPANGNEGNEGNAVSRDLTYSAYVPDDRFQMWRDSLKEASQRPIGSWPCPISLRTHVQLPNGAGMSHSYTSPHNMTLEFAMAFGWLPGLLVLTGSAALAWVAVRSLATTRSVFVAVAAIGCLVELARAQFSGDIWDGFGLLVTSLVVAIAYTTGLQSKDWGTSTEMNHFLPNASKP